MHNVFSHSACTGRTVARCVSPGMAIGLLAVWLGTFAGCAAPEPPKQAPMPKVPVTAEQQYINELMYRLHNYTYSGSARFNEQWKAAILELARIGKPAVPTLTAVLDRTDHDVMMQSIAFTLRGIGDPSAVPSLIAALPRTAKIADRQPPSAVGDALKFHEEAGQGGSYPLFLHGRAAHEVGAALEALTGHSVGHDYMAGGTSNDAATVARVAARREAAATRWRGWWSANEAGMRAETTATLPPVETVQKATSVPEDPEAPEEPATVVVREPIHVEPPPPQIIVASEDFSTASNSVDADTSSADAAMPPLRAGEEIATAVEPVEIEAPAEVIETVVEVTPSDQAPSDVQITSTEAVEVEDTEDVVVAVPLHDAPAVAASVKDIGRPEEASKTDAMDQIAEAVPVANSLPASDSGAMDVVPSDTDSMEITPSDPGPPSVETENRDRVVAVVQPSPSEQAPVVPENAGISAEEAASVEKDIAPPSDVVGVAHDTATASGWGTPVDGLRCRWNTTEQLGVIGEPVTIAMELQNVSDTTVYWECRKEVTWRVRRSGSASGYATPHFEVSFQSGSRPATVGEVRIHLNVRSGRAAADTVARGFYAIAPGTGMTLTADFPWKLPSRGTIELDGHLSRYYQLGWNLDLRQVTVTCPTLKIQVSE